MTRVTLIEYINKFYPLFPIVSCKKIKGHSELNNPLYIKRGNPTLLIICDFSLTIHYSFVNSHMDKKRQQLLNEGVGYDR